MLTQSPSPAPTPQVPFPIHCKWLLFSTHSQLKDILLSLMNYSSCPTSCWVLLEVKAGSYLYFYPIAKYNTWFKMRAQSMFAEWMNESIDHIIFGYYIKQSSKYILHDS